MANAYNAEGYDAASSLVVGGFYDLYGFTNAGGADQLTTTASADSATRQTGSFTVGLRAAAGADLTVNYTVKGTAVLGTDHQLDSVQGATMRRHQVA